MKLRYKLTLPGGQYVFCDNGVELDAQIKWLIEHGVTIANVKIEASLA